MQENQIIGSSYLWRRNIRKLNARVYRNDASLGAAYKCKEDLLSENLQIVTVWKKKTISVDVEKASAKINHSWWKIKAFLLNQDKQ